MKIKCYRFPCEVCQKESSIQVFYKKNGQAGYARARHYGADKKFHYHQQSIEYINRKLGEQPKKSPIDPGQSTKPEFIDQNNVKLSSKVKNMADPMGFEPMTFSLEG